MKKSKLLSSSVCGIIFIIFFTLSMFWGCQESTDKTVDPMSSTTHSSMKKPSLTEKEIDKVAKTLAKLMKKEDIRRLFLEKLNNSSFDGNALDANTFLADLNQMVSAQSDKNDIENALTKMEQNCYKIYFPFAQHKDKWKGGEELYIAGINRAEKDSSLITAYDLNGKEIILSAKTSPNTPTLVITCGNLQKNKRVDNCSYGSPFYSDLLMQGVLPASSNEIYEDQWFNVAVSNMIVQHHYDDWWCDDLEIYIKFKYMLDGGLWSEWVTIYRDNPIILQPGHWKDMNRQICQFGKKFSIKLELWEYDDISNADFVADIYYENLIGMVNGCTTNSDQSIFRCDFWPLPNGQRDMYLQDGAREFL